MVTISDTYIENRERIQPNDTNNYGDAHGGNIMRWMDEIGALCAMRHAGETCVTAYVNNLDFKRPIPQGDTCVSTGYVYAVGRTSLRVRLQAFREIPGPANAAGPPTRISSSSRSTRTASPRPSRNSYCRLSSRDGFRHPVVSKIVTS